MKDRKRLIVYSLLALPFVVFGIFFLTLDPIARRGFFGEFTANTAAQFGFEDDTAGVHVEPNLEAADGGENAAGGPRGAGPGGGGGGFDPAQMFSDRDTDGDGKLTGDEISERMRENLERIDTDKDGSVTLEEMQAGFIAGRGGFDGGSGGSDAGPERPERPE